MGVREPVRGEPVSGGQEAASGEGLSLEGASMGGREPEQGETVSGGPEAVSGKGLRLEGASTRLRRCAAPSYWWVCVSRSKARRYRAGQWRRLGVGMG